MGKQRKNDNHYHYAEIGRRILEYSKYRESYAVESQHLIESQLNADIDKLGNASDRFRLKQLIEIALR